MGSARLVKEAFVFTPHLKNGLTSKLSSMLGKHACLVGTVRRDWQQQHSDAISEVFLFSCFLTVIQDGH